jgi:hypothetical protein
MWAANDARPPWRVRGAYATEFAIILPLLLLLLFGIIEVGRAVYLLNVLPEVTRRAAQQAANTDYRDLHAKERIRQRAVFRENGGGLVFGAPITDEHVRIDYLALTRAGDGTLSLTPVLNMPSCPARNRVYCTADPNDPQCVRFVRVRLCAPGGTSGPTSSCDPVVYQPQLPLVPFPLTLPQETTIVPAETLGYVPRMSPCP